MRERARTELELCQEGCREQARVPLTKQLAQPDPFLRPFTSHLFPFRHVRLRPLQVSVNTLGYSKYAEGWVLSSKYVLQTAGFDGSSVVHRWKHHFLILLSLPARFPNTNQTRHWCVHLRSPTHRDTNCVTQLPELYRLLQVYRREGRGLCSLQAVQAGVQLSVPQYASQSCPTFPDTHQHASCYFMHPSDEWVSNLSSPLSCYLNLLVTFPCRLLASTSSERTAPSPRHSSHEHIVCLSQALIVQ